MIQMRIVKRYYHLEKIDESIFSQTAINRFKILEKYEVLITEGCSKKAALQILEVSRASLFRWKKHYNLLGLTGLENRSKRPHRLRKPMWSPEIIKRICVFRKKYKFWGKYKIAVMYAKKYKEAISASTIGRILKYLINAGKVYPVAFLAQRHIPKPRSFNNHAQRIKPGLKANRPGELIQIDHMSVDVFPLGIVKHFNAVCPITKTIVSSVYRSATSFNAAKFLEKALSSFPFQVHSIQVDGGSEFMGAFESFCANKNIPLFVLPPRSPKQNGNVERSNGTSKYEFYSDFMGESFEDLKLEIDKFSQFYNNVRPHQSLNFLTPSEFYDSIYLGG